MSLTESELKSLTFNEIDINGSIMNNLVTIPNLLASAPAAWEEILFEPS